MAVGTGLSGQAIADMSDGAGPNGQGASAMSGAAGVNGQGASAMSDATGANGHGANANGDPGWPEPGALRAGDRLVLQVDRDRLGAYFEYLSRLAAAAPEGLSVAPFCAPAGGLMRLHLIAAARVALPGRVRVEARHDLLGIRLAQVALGFGADTLAGRWRRRASCRWQGCPARTRRPRGPGRADRAGRGSNLSLTT